MNTHLESLVLKHLLDGYIVLAFWDVRGRHLSTVWAVVHEARLEDDAKTAVSDHAAACVCDFLLLPRLPV